MASTSNLAGLSGEQKAAVLVVLLGQEVSGKLFRHLSKRDVARIAREVAELGPIDPSVGQAVLEEYYLGAWNAPRDQGGPDVARGLLAQASIDEEIVDKLIHDTGSPGDVLGPLLEAPPELLAQALEDEHPQTAALVLLHLPVRRAAQLLAALPEEARARTVLRMATLRQVRGEVLGEVATSLQERLLSARQSAETEDGITRTATVLERMNRIETKRLLEELEEEYPDQVQLLRDRIYTFESLMLADDRGMQELLRQVDSAKVALALAGLDEALQARFFDNLSERAAGMLREEIEFLGSPNPQDQEVARKEILNLALKIEADGALTFAEPSQDDEEESDD
jgi:flagellar motor switch protein FliG